MYLYHVYGPLDHEHAVYKGLKEGLNLSTSSNWTTRGGGGLFPHLIDQIKAGEPDDWMDFNRAFAVYFSPMTFHNYLRVSLPADKVYVFNRDITTDLFSYVEDEYMEDELGHGFMTKGLPSKEKLMRQFWESKLLLSKYLKERPYPNAELLVFDHISPHSLEGFVNKRKIKNGEK